MSVNEKTPARFIDITPTWGEWGNVYRRFAESGEERAVIALRSDVIRVFAFAQAFVELQKHPDLGLREEQTAFALSVFERECAKQGFERESEPVQKEERKTLDELEREHEASVARERAARKTVAQLDEEEQERKERQDGL